MINVVAIVGPTAVGKTKLSIQMAKQLNGEIISGDSMQVYRKLDIGTAKVMPAEMDGIVHHLINIKDFDERFSVAEFKQLAEQLIEDIHQRGKLPIIVGGTGFYLQALTDNLTLGNDDYDETSDKIRKQFHDQLAADGPEALWQQLFELDEAAAKNIQKTGQLFSDQESSRPKYNFKLIGLDTERSVLYQRINQRVDQMIAQGLLDEAKWLYQQGGRDSPASKGIGYHELFNYFDNQISLEVAVENIKKDSRHYAKRQLTWFRNKMTVNWFNLVSGQNTIEQVNNSILKWLK
ncbi:MAG: tRNA (adenosine(37)-N6)-dimethylallyltransferase MiaA [Paucilactobacillus nenjiangensis]